jgi:hypothetical protein
MVTARKTNARSSAALEECRIGEGLAVVVEADVADEATERKNPVLDRRPSVGMVV